MADKERRPYCTQKCLLGLVRGLAMDPGCPDAALHRQRVSNDVQGHPIDDGALPRLLRAQLACVLDGSGGMQSLGKEGTWGGLFGFTLPENGYTFVAKGFEGDGVERAQNEACVYGKLRDPQGIDIPVFLGDVDLGTERYFDDDGLDQPLRHIVFLSFGGEMALDRKRQPCGPDQKLFDQDAFDRQLFSAVKKLHKRGLVHRDLAEMNVLWCEETGRVMLIDFERPGFRDPALLADPSWLDQLEEKFQRDVQLDLECAWDVTWEVKYGEDELG
jgi:hypothetical protein